MRRGGGDEGRRREERHGLPNVQVPESRPFASPALQPFPSSLNWLRVPVVNKSQCLTSMASSADLPPPEPDNIYYTCLRRGGEGGGVSLLWSPKRRSAHDVRKHRHALLPLEELKRPPKREHNEIRRERKDTQSGTES